MTATTTTTAKTFGTAVNWFKKRYASDEEYRKSFSASYDALININEEVKKKKKPEQKLMAAAQFIWNHCSDLDHCSDEVDKDLRVKLKAKITAEYEAAKKEFNEAKKGAAK